MHAEDGSARTRPRRARSGHCPGVDLARKRKGAPAVRPRKRSVRRRPAPRDRRCRRSRCRRQCSRIGNRLLRRDRAEGRQDTLDPDCRRVHSHAPASRLLPRSQGRRRDGGSHGGHGRDEWRARLARAVRLPRHPRDRRRAGIRRPALAAAGARRSRSRSAAGRRRPTRPFPASGDDAGASRHDASAFPHSAAGGRARTAHRA